MRKFVESVGFVVFVQGVAGLLHEWTGWFRLWAVVRRIDFLGEHRMFAHCVLVVTGIAVMIAADSIRETGGGGKADSVKETSGGEEADAVKE